MISRQALYSIVLGIIGVLIITWRMGILPARVVVINQSGTAVSRVTITTDNDRIEFGTVGNGETRHAAPSPTSSLRLSFGLQGPHVWNAPKGLSAAQSIVLYIMPDGQVIARDRIGTFQR